MKRRLGRKGQSFVEYALILAAIIAAFVAIMPLFSGSVTTMANSAQTNVNTVTADVASRTQYLGR